MNKAFSKSTRLVMKLNAFNTNENYERELLLFNTIIIII